LNEVDPGQPPRQKHGGTTNGQADDGNIHVNVMVDYDAPGAKSRSERCLDDLFKQVVKCGGVITGEHGIGLAKKPWWPLAASREVRDLHQLIKGALDPQGVLNPGKFLG
jgi:glycolate oxidase